MAYNSPNRSERLLQGRRFTSDGLTLSQEAFTDVFDLGANEIFTDDGMIPTGSTQLAYSGSSQNLAIVSASIVNPTIETDVSILKFWWRKKLKPAGDGNREVYYFTQSDPSSVDDTVTSDQLIETDQLTNFVSPKYIIAANSVNTTEGTSPGYKVVVYKSTQSSAGGISTDAADPSSYVFDFKTGVLTWLDGSAPASNQFVYITVYQYIGRTLRSQIDDGSIGGSADGTVSGSIQVSHDNTTGFVANEHLDWTSNVGTIHAGNYTDTNTTYTVGDGGLTTNDFTDADHTKLNAIEASADVTDAANVLTSLPAGTVSGSAQIDHDTTTNFVANEHLDWTSNVGTIHAGNYTDTNTTYNVGDGGLSEISFTSADNTKLDAIEASADVTDATNVLANLPSGVISGSVQIDHDSTTNFVANEHIDWTSDQGATNIHSGNYTDTNTTYTIQDGELSQINFTSADNTKLDGVEALADVTDATNVVAALTAGTNIAIAGDGTISSTDTTYSVGDGGLTQINFTSADNTKLDGVEALADVTDATNVLSSLVGSDLVVGSITAESYVISSSVTHMTTSFSSGSTVFGDDILDTHQMTGSLYVSGSVFFTEIDGGNF